MNRRQLLGTGAAVLAAPGLLRAQPAGLLTSTAADRAQRLEAQARGEAGVSLYTSIAQRDIAPLTEAFQRRTGLRLRVWRASGDRVLQRFAQEQQAGRNECDVVHVGSPEMEAMHREGLLQPIVSPHFADLREGAVPAHGEWVATLLSVWVQAYNTGLVRRDDLPRGWRDLLHARWRGRIGIEVENVEWFATIAKSLGGDPGIAFFRELVATNGISVRRGHTLLTNMVVSGEVPFALTVYNYMPAQAKARGAPIETHLIPPAVARANGIGVAKAARNPASAALFVDFMLNEAQEILAGLDYVPITRRLPDPMEGAELRIVDAATALDERARWEPLFQQIIVRGGR